MNASPVYWVGLAILAAGLFFLPNLVANLRRARAYRSIAALNVFMLFPLLFSIFYPDLRYVVYGLWAVTMGMALFSPSLSRDEFKEMIKARRRNLSPGP